VILNVYLPNDTIPFAILSLLHNVSLPYYTIPFTPQRFRNLIKFQSAEQLLAQDNKWRRTMIGANLYCITLYTKKRTEKQPDKYLETQKRFRFFQNFRLSMTEGQ
jgi:hypothetical protein